MLLIPTCSSAQTQQCLYVMQYGMPKEPRESVFDSISRGFVSLAPGQSRTNDLRAIHDLIQIIVANKRNALATLDLLLAKPGDDSRLPPQLRDPRPLFSAIDGQLFSAWQRLRVLALDNDPVLGSEYFQYVKESLGDKMGDVCKVESFLPVTLQNAADLREIVGRLRKQVEIIQRGNDDLNLILTTRRN